MYCDALFAKSSTILNGSRRETRAYAKRRTRALLTSSATTTRFPSVITSPRYALFKLGRPIDDDVHGARRLGFFRCEHQEPAVHDVVGGDATCAFYKRDHTIWPTPGRTAGVVVISRRLLTNYAAALNEEGSSSCGSSLGQTLRSSGSESCVTMMEAADLRMGDHLAHGGELHRPGIGRVLF